MRLLQNFFEVVLGSDEPLGYGSLSRVELRAALYEVGTYMQRKGVMLAAQEKTCAAATETLFADPATGTDAVLQLYQKIPGGHHLYKQLEKLKSSPAFQESAARASFEALWETEFMGNAAKAIRDCDSAYRSMLARM